MQCIKTATKYITRCLLIKNVWRHCNAYMCICAVLPTERVFFPSLSSAYNSVLSTWYSLTAEGARKLNLQTCQFQNILLSIELSIILALFFMCFIKFWRIIVFYLHLNTKFLFMIRTFIHSNQMFRVITKNLFHRDEITLKLFVLTENFSSRSHVHKRRW